MTWDDITIAQYIQIRQILSSNVDDLFKGAELLKVLHPDEDIDNLPLAQYTAMQQELLFLSDEFKPEIKDIRLTYVVGDYKLKLYKNVAEITTAQYIDYSNFVRDLKTELDTIIAYPKILSVFLIPEGKKYNEDYDIMDLQKQIEDRMPITDAVNIAFFLSIYSKIFIKIFLKSFKKKVRKLKMTEDQLHQVETALASMVSLIC